MKTLASSIIFSLLTLNTIHASLIHQTTPHSFKRPQSIETKTYFLDPDKDNRKQNQSRITTDAPQSHIKEALTPNAFEDTSLNTENITTANRKVTTELELIHFTIEIQKITEECGQDIENPTEQFNSFRSSKHTQHIINYSDNPITGEKSMHEVQKIHSLYQNSASGEDSQQRYYQFKLPRWERTGFIKKYENGVGQHLHTGQKTDFIYKKNGCYRIKNISGQPTRFFILHTEYIRQKKQYTQDQLHVVYNSKEAEDPPNYLVEIVEWDGQQLTIDGKPVPIPTGKRTCKFKFGEVTLPIPEDKFKQQAHSAVFPSSVDTIH